MEASMKIHPIVVLTAAVGLAALASAPAVAATSPAMKSCSQQWSAMKQANKVPEGADLRSTEKGLRCKMGRQQDEDGSARLARLLPVHVEVHVT